MTHKAGPGTALKMLRTRESWTLADVSNRTGVPISTLSRIENDIISPTFNQLSKIAAGLGIDFATLVSSRDQAQQQAPTGGRRSINRSGDGDVLEIKNVTLTYLSTDMLQKSFAPVYVEVRARTLEETGGFSSHPGEEYLYVLEGEVQLLSEHYSPLTLTRDESVYFDSSMPHAYVSSSAVPCRLLSICTVPRPHAPATFETHASERKKLSAVPDSISDTGNARSKKLRKRRAVQPA